MHKKNIFALYFSVKMQGPAFLGARVNVFLLSHLIRMLTYNLQLQIYKLIHCFHNNSYPQHFQTVCLY
jgi:hypothetical protein